MRKIFALPLAAIVAVGFVACDTDSTGIAPEGPNFELVSGGIDREDANVEIVATFTTTIPGAGVASTPYRENGEDAVNPDGEVVGRCVAGGAFENRAGRVTGAKPHRHCMNEEVPQNLLISLEPISGSHELYCHASCGNESRRDADKVILDAAGAMFVTWDRSSGQERNWHMHGQGLVVAWAIDQFGNQQGTFTFNLAHFGPEDEKITQDLFNTNVNIGSEEDPEFVWGLDMPITATYTYPDGITTKPVNGWIYWDEIEEDNE